MVTFGNMLAEGRGVGKDRIKAAELYEKAAMTGDPLANYNLGLLFLRGDGKPENPYRAAQHIAYAAEKGIAAAQYDLAAMYLRGLEYRTTPSKPPVGAPRPPSRACLRRSTIMASCFCRAAV